MIINSIGGGVRVALLALACCTVSVPAMAQQQPSLNAVALAREIIVIKGSGNLFEGLVPSIVEQAKALFLQTNPMLSKDLNEVAAKMRADYAPRSAELANDLAKFYASRFTEQELKDILAFYKTTAGKKVIDEEPKIFEEAMNNMRSFGEKFSQDVIARMRGEMKKRGHDL
jgi:uncharacterized protein